MWQCYREKDRYPALTKAAGSTETLVTIWQTRRRHTLGGSSLDRPVIGVRYEWALNYYRYVVSGRISDSVRHSFLGRGGLCCRRFGAVALSSLKARWIRRKMKVKSCKCCVEHDTIEAYGGVEISLHLFLSSVVSSQLHAPFGLPPVGEFHGRSGGAEERIPCCSQEWNLDSPVVSP
jgi:hypothetical protein